MTRAQKKPADRSDMVSGGSSPSRANRLLLEAEAVAHIGAFSRDLKTDRVEWSPGQYRIFGYASDEISPTYEWVREHIVPDDRPRFDSANRALLESGVLYDIEYRIRRKDGAIRKLRSCATLERNDAGDAVRMYGASQDLTDQYRFRQELHESEERFRLLVENLADPVYAHDMDGRFVIVNEAACEATGYTRDELLQMTVADIDAESVDRDDQRNWWFAMEPGHPIQATVRHRRKDGTTHEAELCINRLQLGGKPIMLATARDITERLSHEKSLRKSKAMLSSAGRIAQVGGWEVDVRAKSVAVSEEWQRIHGVSADQLSLDELWPIGHPDDRSAIETAFEAAIEAGKPYDIQHRIIRQTDGAVRVVQAQGEIAERDADGKPVRLYGAAQDITDRIELEQRLRQSQKLEAIGQLAGGVAHDFNNILTAVLGNVELLRQSLVGRMSTDDPAWNSLMFIERAGKRAANLTRQLLAFGRRQVVRPQKIDVARAIHDLAEMLHSLIRENIALDIRCDDELLPIEADTSQLEQVIINLVVNARDAMPTGGRIDIHVTNIEVEPEQSAYHPDAQPGPHVCIAVSDTGPGMNDETLAHVFEPFFTTKAVGQGTGLGLASVHGIARQANGHVTVESAQGHGATFRVYWPAMVDGETSTPPATQPLQTDRTTETILVCEDDANVRDLTARALQLAGYHVLVAQDANEALRTFEDAGDRIDLVVSDVIMPGMNGRDLAQQLLASHPRLKVLFISGYSAEIVAQQGRLEEGMHLLEKPFRAHELLKNVRDVLNA